MLPPEQIEAVADFLSSVDIVRLSGVCKKFHQVFDESYWVSYLSKKQQAHSYLMLSGTLSPSLQRRTFFSHLWYTENRISLAARLGHPEAVVLQKYGSMGHILVKTSTSALLVLSSMYPEKSMMKEQDIIEMHKEKRLKRT